MSYYQPNFLRPKLLNSNEISSWFTLKGTSIQNEVRIPGFNLGFNTDESEQIIQANREYLARTIAVPISKIAFANQVHGTEIKHITNGGVFDGVDGFISQTSGLALAIQVADCAAVILGDPTNGTIAAVHAGWRGAIGGIVEKAVQKMMALNCNPASIEVFLSPCIAVNNFEVGKEVAAQFPDIFVNRTDFEKPHIDLKGFLNNQLLELGINPQNIELNNHCTVSNHNYYSYRREGKASGRMMGIIKLN